MQKETVQIQNKGQKKLNKNRPKSPFYKTSLYYYKPNKRKMKNQQNFHQEIQLSTDEALVLSSPNQIDFPTPTEIRQTIFSTLASFVTFSKINNNFQPAKQFLPIPNEFFLMACGNLIKIYQHSRSTQQQLECQLITQIELQFYIKCVKISPFSKCKKDKGIFLLVEDSSSNFLQTLYLEVSDRSIRPVSTLRIPSRINCWSYINSRQILIWAQNMKIYHYEVLISGLKQIQSLDTGIDINAEVFVQKQKQPLSKSRSKSKAKGLSIPKPHKQKKKSPFILNYCQILGQRGKQQDSIIVLFYVLYNEEINGMKIKCKQILYPFETNESNKNYQFFASYSSNQFPKLKILPETHEIVSHNAASPQILQTISIVKIKEAYLIRFQFEIIVVQKKFNHEYMVVNNIYKKNKGCKVSMAFNSNIVTCITDNILELNKIEIVQSKIQTNMIDFIDLENQFDRVKTVFLQSLEQENTHKPSIQLLKEKSGLFMLWITTDLLSEQHRNQINFVFEACFLQNKQERKTYFIYCSRNVPRVKKLTALAHKAQKPEDIKSIQKLGKNLGINEADFYYSMWKTSQHSYDDVLMYLLKSKDYIKIISQIKGFLRKKSYAATKLQKVLLKLEEMALALLQEKLTEQHLMDYFHIIFVNKKFQIYESNYEIDEREFTETVQISIYDLFKKIINQNLFPAVKVESVWAAQPKKLPKLNLIQVLGYFKLPLLEDYDIFLEKILIQYPLKIVEVISYFPELLPNFPFEDLTSAESNSILNHVRANSHHTKLGEKQKQFFSPVKNEHIKAESNFLDNILDKLYPYYSTSLIKKSFEQVLSRPEIKNQKFIFHSIISTSKQEYLNKLKALSIKSPIYLFTVALDCLIKVSRQVEEEDLDYKYKKITQLCKVFREVHKIQENLVIDMQIMASFFELMIYHEILDPRQFSLNDIISEPIEKWIALFFLGNKQQKDIIFNEFMGIYTQKRSEDKFIEALKKFIESQHCSKIELCILIDLINHMDSDFQRKNQKIIDLIVNGFCSRVQIADIADATNFKQRLCKIQLGQDLLLKADKIEKMSLCRYILSNFYLENTLIKDLLQNTTEVMNKILENWFEGTMKDSSQIKFGTSKKSPTIQIKEIIDMFKLLHFLRENVFYDVKAEELVKIYCKKLIIWQRFEEIHELLYGSEEITLYDIDLPKTISEIQEEYLQQLQKHEDFIFTKQNKQFINKILQIDRDPTNNATVIKMRARIAISQIFLEWKIAVKSSQLEEMCREWEKISEASSENPLGIKEHDIMDQIIETYAEHLNVKALEQLYRYFMIAVTNNPNPETKTERFYRYCTSLCDALLTHHRYKEASEIICIVNQMFEMNYELMAECMLQSVCAIYLHKNQERSRLDIINNSVISCMTEEKKEDNAKRVHKQQKENQEQRTPKRIFTDIFPNEIINCSQNSQVVEEQIEPLQIAKRYVHYFVINWFEDEEGMNKMFSSYFDVDLQTMPALTQVQVHPELCFNQSPFKIHTNTLWEIVKQACENAESPLSLSEDRLIYCYFFILMGLFEPDIGFTLVDYINYNHKVIVNFLTQIMKLCEKGRKQILFLDYSVIFKKYLDSLTKLLILKYQETNPNSDQNEQGSEKSDVKQVKNLMDLSVHHLKSDNLSIIREQFLKTGEYKDEPLINYINKMRILTQQAQKNCKKRAILCSNNKSVKAFSLAGNQSKLKMTMRKNMKNMEKQSQSNEKTKKARQEHMMSFEQFKEIKKAIKDRSQKCIVDLDISERLIVENFFDQMEPNKYKKKTSKTIPELQQIIKTSLQQLEEREKKQKSMLQKSEYAQFGMGEQEQGEYQQEQTQKQRQQAAEQAAIEQANQKQAANKLASLFYSFKGGVR